MTDPQKMAEEHWEWLESLLRKVYIDAMVHGFGHGYEECGREAGDIVMEEIRKVASDD